LRVKSKGIKTLTKGKKTNRMRSKINKKKKETTHYKLGLKCEI
jgi:hypothetical protein